MTAVSAGYYILIGQMGADADRNRLFPRIQMDEPRNAICGELFAYPFFKLANGCHPLVDFK